MYQIGAAIFHHYKEIGTAVIGAYLAISHVGGIRAITANLVGNWPAGFSWKAPAPAVKPAAQPAEIKPAA